MDPVQGQQSSTSGGDEYNALSFIAKQILALIKTAAVVKVVACTNTDAVAPVGYVDVVPLVNQIDGAGKPVAHGTVFNLPYMRLQGGANAVIIDPEPGDIGIAVFADRDISNVKATKAQANPGSFRKFDMADGIYLGMILNDAPVQYVRFHSGGIEVIDKNANAIEMNSTGIVVNGTIFYRDHSVWTDAEITAMSNHTVSAHRHKQGPDSRGDTEQDVNTPYG